MAKGENQKLKMLYLVRIFSRETDEDHALTMPEIIRRLAHFGVSAERKTLYLDFEELRRFGLDLIAEQRGRQTWYYLGSRDFELPELKLLVDAVQASRFITEKKSAQLIRKLERLSSIHEAKHLQRAVLTSGRIKTMNESIYYNVDKIHAAIGENRQIRFHYFQWNVRKEMELRRGGAWYRVSPWGLVWDDENYYLVAHDAREDRIKHYRVDKMLHLEKTKEARQGRDRYLDMDLIRYQRRLFGMFGGEEMQVTLEAENAMAGILIDRFGKDVNFRKKDADHIEITVDVAVSPQFLSWVAALGKGIRITGPDRAVELMRREIMRLRDQYSV